MLPSNWFLRLLSISICIISLNSACTSESTGEQEGDPSIKEAAIQPVNLAAITPGADTLAILHPRIITGDGRTVIEDGAVMITGDRISAVGPFSKTNIPEGVETLDATGATLLPGLIDAHFHLNRIDSLASLFLRNGVTSLRDPGAWITDYDPERASGRPLPRLYLTGPHIDMYPPAYPTNSFVVRDGQEAAAAVRQFAERGASAIKVYFKSSLEVIQASCRTADEIGIPVTAHLEITDIYDAVGAGIDGIEHITSVGYNLVSPQEAEAYKQAILEDTDARREGRYRMWADIDPTAPEATRLGRFLAEQGAFLCPTLDAFEYQPGPDGVDSMRLIAFHNMLSYTKQLYDLGVPIVVGSHGWVRYAAKNWSFHHEMELLERAGLPPLAIIHGGALLNARFLGIEDQLGSIEPGKLADLVLVERNPLEGIAAMRQIRNVMLGGRWVRREGGMRNPFNKNK